MAYATSSHSASLLGAASLLRAPHLGHVVDKIESCGGWIGDPCESHVGMIEIYRSNIFEVQNLQFQNMSDLVSEIIRVSQFPNMSFSFRFKVQCTWNHQCRCSFILIVDHPISWLSVSLFDSLAALRYDLSEIFWLFSALSFLPKDCW